MIKYVCLFVRKKNDERWELYLAYVKNMTEIREHLLLLMMAIHCIHVLFKHTVIVLFPILLIRNVEDILV